MKRGCCLIVDGLSLSRSCLQGLCEPVAIFGAPLLRDRRTLIFITAHQPRNPSLLARLSLSEVRDYVLARRLIARNTVKVDRVPNSDMELTV